MILVPALGGLIVGILIHRYAPEAKGHGVPEVMASVDFSGGRIRPQVVLIKALASAVCIGSGGSAGREGPIVQMGSATGSTIAQSLRFPPYWTKILVACGTAGGIAGTFNTPVAAVLFALELILRELRVTSLTPIVIAAVFATLVSRTLLEALGVETAFIFEVPEYALVTPWEILFYLLLGILAAGGAAAFIRVLYAMEGLFDSLKAVSPPIKPALGGLALGMLAVAMHQLAGEYYILGVGYETMESLLAGDLVFGVVVTLVGLKILATSLTLGSGGSGGVFAPSLFIGAMLGGAFGLIVHQLFPASTATFQPYAIVGMVALFAGVSGTILTSIVMAFEMTGDYPIIVPVMFACVISAGVARFISPGTIYTLKLNARGLTIEQEMSVTLLKTVKAADVMTRDVMTVHPELPIREFLATASEVGFTSFPVTAGDGRLVGIITDADISETDIVREGRDLTVGDLMSRDVSTVTPEDSLESLLIDSRSDEISHFPVVDPESRRLQGFITKGDIIRAYKHRRLAEFNRELEREPPASGSNQPSRRRKRPVAPKP
jgi:CIC family chloride channel protein